MAAIPNTYRLEAEDLKFRYGFSIKNDYNVGASKEAYAWLPWYPKGKATGVFDGEDGLYEIKIAYYDENDGQSDGYLTVDGIRERFRLDKDLGDDKPSENTLTETVTHDKIALQKGDSLDLIVRAQGDESGAIDYIEFREILPDDSDTEQDPASEQPDDLGQEQDPSEAPDSGQDASSGAAGFGSAEEELIRLINEIRVQYGRNELTVNAKLNAAAEGHSDDMANLDYFSGRGQDGSRGDDWMREEGYDPGEWDGTFGAGTSSPEQMVKYWLNNNSTARSHILETDVTEVGAGLVTLSPDPGNVNYQHYWSLLTAAPNEAAPPPDETETDQSNDPGQDPQPDQPDDPPQDPGSGSDGFGFFEQEVIRLTNEFRIQNGRSALTADDRLNRAAEGHSEDMAELNFFSHSGRDGSRAGDRIEDEGYTGWRTWGENIAAGQNTPEQVVNAWINSSGHRANMLNSNFEEIGVGFVEDTDGVGYGEYWTQVFAA